jgi:hypothetical protein
MVSRNPSRERLGLGDGGQGVHQHRVVLAVDRSGGVIRLRTVRAVSGGRCGLRRFLEATGRRGRCEVGGL